MVHLTCLKNATLYLQKNPSRTGTHRPPFWQGFGSQWSIKSSQNRPIQPWVQLHWKSLNPSTQIPPWRQSTSRHSSISSWNNTEETGKVILHAKPTLAMGTDRKPNQMESFKRPMYIPSMFCHPCLEGSGSKSHWPCLHNGCRYRGWDCIHWCWSYSHLLCYQL